MRTLYSAVNCTFLSRNIRKKTLTLHSELISIKIMNRENKCKICKFHLLFYVFPFMIDFPYKSFVEIMEVILVSKQNILLFLGQEKTVI